jgi:uncharacterized membrane protein (UPF0127 family)
MKIKIKSMIPKFKNIKLGNFPLNVEIAKSEKERAKGLSSRNEILDGTGMLFIFPEEDFHSFWMRDTRIPLMVYWIDRNNCVIDNSALVPYDLSKISPKEKASMAIEVPLKWAENNKIEMGDKILF